MNNDKLSKQRIPQTARSNSPAQTGIEQGTNSEAFVSPFSDEQSASDPTTDGQGVRPRNPTTPATPAIDDDFSLAETADPANRSEAASANSRQIGNYRLLQQLGSGGMGDVWVAEQTYPVKRRVALKLIKKGLDSKEIVARFAAERQALALMNHPNIARILDAGTSPEGQPFFVMEWVNGKTLTRYCDENRLGIEERLRLFMDICSGVQHAHQKGIIHRDLKPGNIIVGMQDGQPTPKIIDFGLAKALESAQRLTDQSLYTGIGQILGTLRYMSPEQASLDNLDIDTRSDIYALGIILYELLTGSTPLDDSTIKGQAALKLLEIIRDKEPVKPSSRLSSCSHELVSTITGQRKTDSVRLRKILLGDLDWIVMKALEKDRTRRYESASGFAADIQRYMNSEPVIARPPSLNYRLRKFTRKNRIGVAATTLVSLALIGGLVGTSLGQREALRQAEIAREETRQKEAALAAEKRQRQEVETQKQVVEQQTERALAAEALAESRLKVAERNLAFARQGNEILGSIFSELDPQADYAKVSDLRTALSDNLQQASARLQEAAVGDPLDVAIMQETLGRSLVGLGESALAIELFEQAIDVYSTVQGPSHPDTLECLNNLAISLQNAGRLPEAIKLWAQIGEELKSTPEVDPYLTLAVTNNLAEGYLATGQLEMALTLKQETLDLARVALGRDHPQTLASMNNLAAAYRAMGQMDLVLPLVAESYELLKTSLGPDHPDTLASLNNLASSYRAVGQLEKALPLHELAVERRIAILGQDHVDTLISVNNLALAYLNQGKFEQALPLFERNLEQRLEKLGAAHPDTLLSQHNLAGAYLANAQPGLAFPLWEDTLDARIDLLGTDHPETIATMSALGRGYLENERALDAIPLLERAWEMGQQTFGSQHPTVLSNMNTLAMAYRRTEQNEKALPLLEKVLETRTEIFGLGHPSTLASVNNLADGYLVVMRTEDVRPLLKILQTNLGSDHDYSMNTTSNLATAYWSSDQPALAIPLFEELLIIQESKFGRRHSETQSTLANLVVNYHDAGRLEDALPLLDEVWETSRDLPSLKWVRSKILAVYADLRRADDFDRLATEELELAREQMLAESPELAAMLTKIGSAYLRLDQIAQAVKLLREAVDIAVEKAPGEWTTFDAQSLLGEGLVAQALLLEEVEERTKTFAEAETLLLVGYQGLRECQASIADPAGPKIIAALDRLIRLCDLWEKAEESQKYRRLRDEFPSP